MNWKEHLKSQGYTDEEISNMEKTFGADKMAKAFEAPMAAAKKAADDAAAAKASLDEWETKYQTEILPEISKTYKDAINYRTEAEGLRARLAAAKEYGFLSEPATPPATPPAAAPPNPVPGSPGAIDPRYVQATDFSKAVNDIPDMLGRLTKMSNEHFSLFGSPLLDVDELIAESKKSGGKKSVYDIWGDKYKVEDKRKELAAKKQAEYDKKIADEAVTKYLSEHGQPFTRPAVPSIATRFTGQSKEDSRKPWLGAKDRKDERRQTMVNAVNKVALGAA